MLDFDVAILHPSERLDSFSKGRNPGVSFLIVLGEPMQEHDAPYALGLLRTRHERPRCRRAAEKRDELAPLHVPRTDHALCKA